MNRYVSSLAIWGCLLYSLCACHHSMSYPETLLRADSLMSTHPDSALILLAHFSDSLSGADEAVQMYYRLLVTKGNDKCYIPHRSDSIMKEVVAYYQKYGPANKRMEAYYYLGSVYRDLQDAPRALDCFQRAIEASDAGREYKF